MGDGRAGTAVAVEVKLKGNQRSAFCLQCSTRGRYVITFLAGVALSIPLSIIANLYTPKFQERLSRRSSTRIAKRYDAIVEEYRIVCSLREDSRRLQLYFMRKSLFFTGMAAVVGLFLATLFIPAILAIVNHRDHPDPVPQWANWIFLPIALMMAGTIITIHSHWSSVRRILHQIEDFDGYLIRMDKRLAAMGKGRPNFTADTQ